MTPKDQEVLDSLGEVAFEIIKNSPKEERKFKIEDFGDHCVVHLTIRVVKSTYQNYPHLIKS